MTVVKRQAQSPAGVSSEVEVLKALKSLFEHHKALDEKVREKLRVALDRVAQVEEELAKSKEEVEQLKEKKSVEIISNGFAESVKLAASNGQNHVNEDMTNLIESQTTELQSARSKISELSTRLRELEDALSASEELQNRVQEEKLKLMENLRENISQKEDQEERISTLEKRYVHAQRESTSLHDAIEKLKHELASREGQIKLYEEKINAMIEKLDLAEQRLSQIEFEKKQEAMIREASEDRDDQRETDDARQMSLEERIKRLEGQLEEKSSELSRTRQRERMNEEHNQRLSATVDKLLAESNERLQQHLKERMAALEEKNVLNQDLERTRRLLDDTQVEKEKIIFDLAQTRSQVETLQNDLQSIKSETLKATISNKSASRNSQRRDWDKVNHHFEPPSDTECSQTDDNESVVAAVDNVLISPSGHTGMIRYFAITFSNFDLNHADSNFLSQMLKHWLSCSKNNWMQSIMKFD